MAIVLPRQRNIPELGISCDNDFTSFVTALRSRISEDEEINSFSEKYGQGSYRRKEKSIQISYLNLRN